MSRDHFALIHLCLGRRRVLRIRGASMQPALRDGDLVWVDPGAYRRRAPGVGELVVVRHPYRPAERMVKRVAHRHGDGRVEVRGDNPLQSTDSRSFGALGADCVLGRVTGALRCPPWR